MLQMWIATELKRFKKAICNQLSHLLFTCHFDLHFLVFRVFNVGSLVFTQFFNLCFSQTCHEQRSIDEAKVCVIFINNQFSLLKIAIVVYFIQPKELISRDNQSGNPLLPCNLVQLPLNTASFIFMARWTDVVVFKCELLVNAKGTAPNPNDVIDLPILLHHYVPFLKHFDSQVFTKKLLCLIFGPRTENLVVCSQHRRTFTLLLVNELILYVLVIACCNNHNLAALRVAHVVERSLGITVFEFLQAKYVALLVDFIARTFLISIHKLLFFLLLIFWLNYVISKFHRV